MVMEITELMEGARNCVNGFCGIKSGEEALILTSPSRKNDPLVIDALAVACRDVGANVTALVFNPPPHEMWHVPPIIAAAMCQANVIFGVGTMAPLHGRAGGKAMYEHEAMLCNVAADTPELMASEWARFPMEVTWAIARRVFEVTRNSKTFHVTDDAGTDMVGGIHPTHITGFPVNIEPGPGLRTNHGVWPGATCGLHPEGDVHGVIVASYDHEHNLSEPMKILVEKHRAVKIEGGGIDGIRWRANHKRFKDANWSCECMWGMHPKVNIWKSPGVMAPMASRRSGTLHFGFGNGRALGGNIVTNYHDDVVLLKPTLYLDDFKMIENGKLIILNEPGIREVANKYGNPDIILAEVD